jgi:hypothetical protein
MRLQLAGAACWLATLCGCGGETLTAEPPDVDRVVFEAEVYPVLLRDCAFSGCHGNPSRFFRIYGPGRTRLDPGSAPYAPATGPEIDATFDRARSMLSGASDPRQALLVRKPLEASAGGAAHMGSDSLGRNVYGSTDDPSWRILARWAGAIAAEDAGPTEEDAGAPLDAPADDAPADSGGADAPEDAP